MFDWDSVSKTFQLPEQTIQLLNKIQLGLIITKPEQRSTTTSRYISHPPNNKPKAKPPNSVFTKPSQPVNRGFSKDHRGVSSSSTHPPRLNGNAESTHLAIVQASLNKLTEKNYNAQLEIITEAHASLLVHSQKPMDRILELIFRTTSSGIHARLIDDLAKIDSPTNIDSVYAYITVVFEQFEADVSGLNTDPVDPVAHYDEFCRVTKQNDRCRTTASFFIHLVDKQLISSVPIVILLRKWLDRVTIIVDIPDKLTEVEMVTELVSRFAPILAKKYQDQNQEPNAEQCRDHIRKIQQFKVSEKKSFSSRVLFKYRDMASLYICL